MICVAVLCTTACLCCLGLNCDERPCRGVPCCVLHYRPCRVVLRVTLQAVPCRVECHITGRAVPCRVSHYRPCCAVLRVKLQAVLCRAACHIAGRGVPCCVSHYRPAVPCRVDQRKCINQLAAHSHSDQPVAHCSPQSHTSAAPYRQQHQQHLQTVTNQPANQLHIAESFLRS